MLAEFCYPMTSFRFARLDAQIEKSLTARINETKRTVETMGNINLSQDLFFRGTRPSINLIKDPSFLALLVRKAKIFDERYAFLDNASSFIGLQDRADMQDMGTLLDLFPAEWTDLKFISSVNAEIDYSPYLLSRNSVDESDRILAEKLAKLLPQ